MESRIHKILSKREAINEKYKHVSLEMETSTHFPLLMMAVEMTVGPILELGSGLFSTPLLHWMCFESKRKVTTCESYKHYLEFAEKFKTDWHDVRFIPPTETPVFEGEYGLVFIDHSPKLPRTRGGDALLFKDSADVIIMHDAGEDAHGKYGYKEIYDQFKYVYHWTGCIPHTTALSNTVDVRTWTSLF